MQAHIQGNQGPALPGFAVTIRSVSLSISLLLLGASLTTYFLSDAFRPVGFLAHNLGETVGAFNDFIRVAGASLDGGRIIVGSTFNHAADVWCKIVPGPACDARRQPEPEKPEMTRDLSKAPVANTQEMVDAYQQLSEFLVESDFEKRVHLFMPRARRSKWNVGITEQLNVNGKGAIEDYNTVVSCKNSAVSQTGAMIQHLLHQYSTLGRDVRRPISWSNALVSPSKWGRYDLHPDVVAIVKDTAFHMDQSRKLLIECSYASKSMKRRVLKLLELSESQIESFAEIKGGAAFMDEYFCGRNCPLRGLDSQVKEWKDFRILLESIYDTVVAADKKCSDLDNTMRHWMINFNNTRGLSYDLESKSLIGPYRNPIEIIDILEGTILLFEQALPV